MTSYGQDPYGGIYYGTGQGRFAQGFYGDGPVNASAARPQRGPKGYRRSGERIREDLCERLMASPHIDSSDVEVRVERALVLLSGTVPVRSMKHAIEDLAAASPGVQDIDNRIRVPHPDR